MWTWPVVSFALLWCCLWMPGEEILPSATEPQDLRARAEFRRWRWPEVPCPAVGTDSSLPGGDSPSACLLPSPFPAEIAVVLSRCPLAPAARGTPFTDLRPWDEQPREGWRRARRRARLCARLCAGWPVPSGRPVASLGGAQRPGAGPPPQSLLPRARGEEGRTRLAPGRLHGCSGSGGAAASAGGRRSRPRCCAGTRTRSPSLWMRAW